MTASTSNQTWRQILDNHPIQRNIRQFLSNFPLKSHKPLHKNRELLEPTLYIWGPGWKTPQETSFDQECLKWQTYLKFSGINFDIKNANEPLISPSGKLPVFILPTGEIIIKEQLKFYVDNLKTDKIGKISDERLQAESQAFIVLADTKLQNALLYTLWCDPVYEQHTHGKYCGHYAKPLDKILMYQAKNDAIKEMLIRKPVLIRDEIYQDAAEALQAISVTLGKDQYFFGTRSPTFIDAVIFSYIHTILTLPITSSNDLSQLVHKHNNLVEFSKRIYDEFFE